MSVPESTLFSFLDKHNHNFTITRSYNPSANGTSLAAKVIVVVFCEPRKEKRVKILLPPGTRIPLSSENFLLALEKMEMEMEMEMEMKMNMEMESVWLA